MPTATFLWRVEIRVPWDAVSAFEEALEPKCMAVSSFRQEAGTGATDRLGADQRARTGTKKKSSASETNDLWRVEGFMGAEPDPLALDAALAKAARAIGVNPPKARIHLVPPRDWVAENLADFPPVRVGRYFIHGSHYGAPPPGGRVAIQLDAGAAFGSGEHPSTAACLMALDRLAKGRRFLKPLDMGCGSGILALAMAKTWRVPVIASDLDDEAVRVTARNAGINGVGRLVRTACGPGYRTPAVAKGGPYDLIVANILARPIRRMAGEVAHHLERRGVAVLSGFLERDGLPVLARHRAFGLKLASRITIDGWQTLVVVR